MKTISFAIPCYNSADYMDHCVESLLPLGDDIEIIIVDDGSTKDDTPAKADGWAQRYPDIVKAIHQENGGHGEAVNTGLAHATGVYFKVVDSDDWLDDRAMEPIMAYLREQVQSDHPTDLVLANYVYEKVHENKRVVMDYRNVFPEGREFGWDDVGHFNQSQYILMHSTIYRRQLLIDMGLKLPAHTFYVDNIFVYEPLVHVKTMRYFDEDMYRYFIGREDQSVNEKVMMSRVDQQLRVTRQMIDNVDVQAIENRNLRHYMRRYLSMMMCICSVFLRLRGTTEDDEKLHEIWQYLKNKDHSLYLRVRTNVLNIGTNLPTRLGRKAGITGYHIAQHIYNFN